MTSQNNLASAGWFILVAVMWGGTNPFIKKGSRGIERIKEEGKFRQIFSELVFLFSNWKKQRLLHKSSDSFYLIPFLINQSGSVVYYLTLATADISLAVPITNSLTFIFTILSGRLLGEKISNIQTYIGMVIVLIGVLLCVSDKW